MPAIINNTLYNRKPYRTYSFGVVLSFFNWIITSITNKMKTAKIKAELQAYSDRELDDIGIARFQINSVANGSFVRNKKH